MIFVDRARVPEPAILVSERARKAQHEALAFFGPSRSRRSRLQERFEFDMGLLRLIRPDLRRLFAGKCAYCETPEKSGELESFRPHLSAAGLKGELQPYL